MQLSQLFTAVLSTAFLLYVCYSLWTLSQLFKVTQCEKSIDRCIIPLLKDGDQLQVRYQYLCARDYVCFLINDDDFDYK